MSKTRSRKNNSKIEKNELTFMTLNWLIQIIELGVQSKRSIGLSLKDTGSNDGVMRRFNDSLCRFYYSPQAKSYIS